MSNKLNWQRFQVLSILKSLLSIFCTIAVLLLFSGIAVEASAETFSNNPLSFKTKQEIAYSDSAKVYKVVEQMPEIVGGVKQIYKYISYPRKAKINGVEGRVFISFIVDKDGSVQEPKILRDIGAGCGEAAVKAIKKIKFTPGRHKGKAVKVQYSLPVTFRFQD